MESHLDLPIGPRLLTVLIYLNKPEQGGETLFPKLGIKVTPEIGKILIFPNVLNINPNRRDTRMKHAGLAVQKGVKYVANYWLHMYNFHGPYKIQCSG